MLSDELSRIVQLVRFTKDKEAFVTATFTHLQNHCRIVLLKLYVPRKSSVCLYIYYNRALGLYIMFPGNNFVNLCNIFMHSSCIDKHSVFFSLHHEYNYYSHNYYYNYIISHKLYTPIALCYLIREVYLFRL